MIRLKDPSAMTPEERLVEIAAILARGYGRMLLPRSDGDEILADGELNQLAILGSVEPSCSRAVNTRENEEVA